MNLLKNLKDESETYYYLKVSGVDLFKNLNARARGGRPGLIIMLKVFQAFLTFWKNFKASACQASPGLITYA